MKTLSRLQAALAAHDTAIETMRDTEEQLNSARDALDAELRAEIDSASIMGAVCTDERQAHLARMERAIADAIEIERDPYGCLLDNRGAVTSHGAEPPRD